MIRPTKQKINGLGFFARLIGFYLALSYAQRLLYVGWIFLGKHQWPEMLPLALLKGLLFDLGAAFYMFWPVALCLVLVPGRLAQSRWFKIPLMTLALVPLTVAAVSAVCEGFFFDEFHARFNFIAVDYLIYTTEVVRNILESYPLPVVIAAFGLPGVMLYLLLRRWLRRLDLQPSTWPGFARVAPAGVAMILCAALVSEDSLLSSDAYWPREISKNSMFALFSAYRRNSITYNEFYASLPPEQALKQTALWLEPTARVGADGILSREIKGDGPERHWNVVMIVMESMSAGFMAHFGNPILVTPNLDRLADESMFFTNLYATGTRTVRGLEALTLSLPPTPGQSILRRPNSDGLFNLGSVFAQHGYATQFLYGGYAYFDNMKEWYESNGFQVVDRGQFPTDEIHFANAWGVCDEDLFSQVLKQEERIVATHKPFFQIVMTTSNHRPYTFPEGRIDIKPHTGREGALKYSDFAVGKLVEEAKTKSWFKDTLFIFVADHDASVAGGTDIPVHDFLIPAIIYNPQLVPPQKITKLASQIDLAPTLLGLLNFSYTSKFYGEDLMRFPGGRALLGTYQKVAYLQPHSLTILAPGHLVETQTLDDAYKIVNTSSQIARDASSLPEIARTTIAIYQSASELFMQGKLKMSGTQQP